MKSILKLSAVATLIVFVAAPIVGAQENSGQDTKQMMSGDMSSMQNMMQMMEKMGPMMEACSEMMQAMNNSHEKDAPEPKEG